MFKKKGELLQFSEEKNCNIEVERILPSPVKYLIDPRKGNSSNTLMFSLICLGRSIKDRLTKEIDLGHILIFGHVTTSKICQSYVN